MYILTGKFMKLVEKVMIKKKRKKIENKKYKKVNKSLNLPESNRQTQHQVYTFLHITLT